MSEDVIGLPFGDQTDGRRPNRRRKGKHRDYGKAEKRRSRIILTSAVVVLVIALAGMLYGGNMVFQYFFPPDYSGPGSGAVTVAVGKGTLTDIGETLYDQDVVKSAKAFAKAASENTEGDSISPGTYKMRKQMKASDAVQLLLDPSSRIETKFTVPEGYTARQIFDRISEKTQIKKEELTAAAAKPAELGLPAWAKGSLEGFLYPDTYTVQPDDDATKILKTMVASTVQKLKAANFEAKAKQVNLDPLDALKVASLLQGEGIPTDHPKIARVVYNRLQKNMPLEFDSTTVYGRELRGIDRQTKLTTGELRDPNDTYSTYSRKGLPPTPIGNPGAEAFSSAVAPVAGPWLFFVKIDKQGRSAFATTNAEHEKNIATAKRNGALP